MVRLGPVDVDMPSSFLKSPLRTDCAHIDVDAHGGDEEYADDSVRDLGQFHIADVQAE